MVDFVAVLLIAFLGGSIGGLFGMVAALQIPTLRRRLKEHVDEAEALEASGNHSHQWHVAGKHRGLVMERCVVCDARRRKGT